MVKRVWLCLVWLVILTVPVGAKETGSIRLVMRYQGSAVSDGTVSVYDVTEYSANADPEVLAMLLPAMNVEGQSAAIGWDGTVCFSGLQKGCYLVVQEQAPAGYYKMKPFLITVPVTVNDRLRYEIDAYPKLEKIPGTKLPQTGQWNLQVWALAAGGIFLTGIGFTLRKRK